MTNQELIKACIKNQRVAQKALYDQYRGQMYSVCLRYCTDQDTACDALQEGFINVFENIHRLTDPLRLEAHRGLNYTRRENICSI
ncbi:MAG: sigma-70 family RNA polymerase sigma factor [Saprospiraceae bacterium]|nr:sigma-70 family RNA polymerase sigma factor [Saprospiraceae bacterium]